MVTGIGWLDVPHHPQSRRVIWLALQVAEARNCIEQERQAAEAIQEKLNSENEELLEAAQGDIASPADYMLYTKHMMLPLPADM